MRRLLSALLLVGCVSPTGAQDGPALKRAWDEFAGADAAKAYQALWRFTANPDAAVPFFAAQLRPTQAADPARLRQLLSDLQSDDFSERDAANKELEKLGDLAADALAETLKKPLVLEAKRRVEALRDRLDRPTLLPDERLATRAVEALEMIGSADARRLLQQYATGAAGARLTRLAQEAVGAWIGGCRCRRLRRRTATATHCPLAPSRAWARLRYRFGDYSGGHVFFTPDGRGVASLPFGPIDGPVPVFDPASGKVLYEIPGSLGGNVHAFAFSPGGKTLAYSVQTDKSSELRLIDWPSGKRQQLPNLGAGSTEALAFLGPTELALVRTGGAVHVWDLAGRRKLRQVQFPVKVGGSWQLSPDGKVLAAGEGRHKRRLYLWEWQTDKPVRTIVGPERGFERVEFSPDGSILATQDDSDVVSIRLWDVATGKLRRRLVADTTGGHVTGLSFARRQDRRRHALQFASGRAVGRRDRQGQARPAASSQLGRQRRVVAGRSLDRGGRRPRRARVGRGDRQAHGRRHGPRQ